jgi:thioredoxin reductase (NADPH)
MLEEIGLQFDPKTMEPAIDLESLESNLQGLYLAGSLIAGRNANKIFIENSREHGEIILTDLTSKF